MRIYSKLIIAFLAFIIVPVMFVSYMVFHNSENIIKKRVFSKLNVIADIGAMGFEAALSEKDSDLDIGMAHGLTSKSPFLEKSFEVLIVKKTPDNKIIFMSPRKHESETTTPTSMNIGEKDALPAQKAVSGESGFGISVDYRGKGVLSAWRAIRSSDYGLVVKVDSEEAFRPIGKLKKLLIVIVLITVFSAVLGIIAITKSISDPIKKLHKGVEIIGAGDLDHRVGTNTKDEIGQLSRTFDRMTEHIKRTTSSVENLNKEIVERKKTEDLLKKKTLESAVRLKESLHSREILTSMLNDNNEVREKIAQSEAMFRSIFDEARDGILMVDPESKKFYMSNKAICKMLGYSKDEINNLRVMDIHPEKDIPYAVDQFERQAREEFSLSKDMPVKRKDGTVFYADVGATPISVAGKMYLMGFFHDVTEHREVEDLKRIDKLKKDFISNMSHELRTPLNAVIGFSEVLVDQKFGSLNDVQKDYLNDILESGKFLLSLINDILELAKVESGKMGLRLSDFSLKELLEHSLIFVKEEALNRNIEISLEIAKEVGPIRADERKVRQILFNLLSNAVKFTPDGGKIGINAKIKGPEAEVTVWDTGIGISEEDQDKLFNAFVRLETPMSKGYEGTGLGLSLAKDFVELHKGKMWMESEGRGKGSSFKFSLPIRAA